jgi:hypothetical protein
MSESETAPLNPSRTEDDDPEFNPSDPADETSDMPALKKRRDPLYLLIFYGLSSLISLSALSCALWGYIIVITAPFDEQSKASERDGYEKYFWGMQSIVVLVHTITLLQNLVQRKILMNINRTPSTSSGAGSISTSRSKAANRAPKPSGC